MGRMSEVVDIELPISFPELWEHKLSCFEAVDMKVGSRAEACRSEANVLVNFPPPMNTSRSSSGTLSRLSIIRP